MNPVALNMLLQVLDGVLTYIGVSRGHVEMNPIISATIAIYGAFTAIVLVKTLACGLIFLIGRRVQPATLCGVAGTYLVFAIVPWAALLWGVR